jgi:hypothetical protein
MSRNRYLRNASLIAACAFLLASCGGNETARSAASAAPAMATSPSTGADDSPESPQASPADAEVSMPLEAGAGDTWPRRVECPERRSWTMKAKVNNSTSLSLTLGAGPVDCNDWSGVSTPPTVMTGRTLSEGDTSAFNLEPSDNTDRNWTIGVMAGSKEIGRFRARIPLGAKQVRLGDAPYGANGCTTQRIGADPSGIDPIASPAKIDEQTFRLSSDGLSVFVTVCGPDGQITDAVTGGGPTSRAEQGQTEGEGPAMAAVMDTIMCIENFSSVTPRVTFTEYKKQTVQGPLSYGAKACATGWSFFGNDVEGRIGMPAPNMQMQFYATNPVVGSANAGLLQTNAGYCFVGSNVGESKTWDDGLLIYVLERKPDGLSKEFRLTIRDSVKPSTDGKPRICTGSTGGGGLI